jgi:hypothetical protein
MSSSVGKQTPGGPKKVTLFRAEHRRRKSVQAAFSGGAATVIVLKRVPQFDGCCQVREDELKFGAFCHGRTSAQLTDSFVEQRLLGRHSTFL